ncbi:hypothetical protein ebA665 [Aromatoleum aromaticum EbN1]|uniref:Uncharacterized protein n=1 Tax=Aromatoleum aromaticum (strain DSM 19018 / LMG 30748 / EbN1) TaxID=76114 RepID=Q5P891_AROAE|nr:hypothetical protein ebA665 [Aromatoleum aromaticum EbN1]
MNIGLTLVGLREAACPCQCIVAKACAENAGVLSKMGGSETSQQPFQICKHPVLRKPGAYAVNT